MPATMPWLNKSGNSILNRITGTGPQPQLNYAGRRPGSPGSDYVPRPQRSGFGAPPPLPRPTGPFAQMLSRGPGQHLGPDDEEELHRSYAGFLGLTPPAQPQGMGRFGELLSPGPQPQAMPFASPPAFAGQRAGGYAAQPQGFPTPAMPARQVAPQAPGGSSHFQALLQGPPPVSAGGASHFRNLIQGPQQQSSYGTSPQSDEEFDRQLYVAYYGKPPTPTLPATNVTADPFRRREVPAAPASQNPLQRIPQASPQGFAGLPTDQQAGTLMNQIGVAPINTYTPSYQERPLDRVRGAGSREQLIAQSNHAASLGLTPTLREAADDPNYNANGALFQGAKLGMNPNGSAYFREGPQPTDYAGASTTAEQAQSKRDFIFGKMQANDVGQVDQQTGAFMGYGGLQKQSMDQMRGRLAAGGTWQTTLTPEQLAQNRINSLTQQAVKKSAARDRVAEMANEKTTARRARMGFGDPLQQMLRNNPGVAMQLQNANLERQNKLQIAQEEGNADRARAQIGGLAALIANGVPLADARNQVGMAPMAGQPGQQQQVGATDLNAKIHFGGKASENDLAKLHEIKNRNGDRRELVAAIAGLGLKGKELDDALNQVLGTRFATANNPNFWGRAQNFTDWFGNGSMPGGPIVVPGS